MDIFLDLIVWLVRALVGDSNKPQQTALPSSRPEARMPARRPPAHSQPMAPTTQAPAQSPVEYEGRWRNVLTLLALALLFIMVAVWFVYTQGSATGG